MPRNTDEIPVYMFLGFLESGKTKFIQETLEDKRFNKGERTLVLLCEEGIEEIDTGKFPKKNVFVRMIEDQSELTTANLQRFVDETNAERVIVEYNGMWLVNDFFNAMPESFTVYQVMMFADATTFLTYNANMRDRVVDKLNLCELVVFNRFPKGGDVMEYHKIVRATSRRTEIAYEFDDGNVSYDDIEDPLPFDVEKPEFIIDDRDYALFYRDIMEDPEKYDGKVITFKGVVTRNEKFPDNTFAVGRNIMTCCEADTQYCWFVVEVDNAEDVLDKGWIIIKARIEIHKHKFYRGKGPVLTMLNMTKSAPPEQPTATFY